MSTMGEGEKKMRIISGKWKGRRLKAPPGMNTRPTSDKVKEAMFHRIGPYFDGGVGLDLYAGSGSLGIEALSRGFSSFVFVDNNRRACQTIHSNLKMLNMLSHSVVLQMEAKRALFWFGSKRQSFDLICMDPPYDDPNFNIERMLRKIGDDELLNEDGLIYWEHRSTLKVPLHVSSLFHEKTYEYGDTSVSLYRKDR